MPDPSHYINSLAVMAMLTALKQCAQSLDQLIHFATDPFPEKDFRHCIESVQKNHEPSLRLTPEEIDMICELGRLAHKMGTLPDAVDYHQRAEKLRSVLERKYGASKS